MTIRTGHKLSLNQYIIMTEAVLIGDVIMVHGDVQYRESGASEQRLKVTIPGNHPEFGVGQPPYDRYLEIWEYTQWLLLDAKKALIKNTVSNKIYRFTKDVNFLSNGMMNLFPVGTAGSMEAWTCVKDNKFDALRKVQAHIRETSILDPKSLGELTAELFICEFIKSKVRRGMSIIPSSKFELSNTGTMRVDVICRAKGVLICLPAECLGYEDNVRK